MTTTEVPGPAGTFVRRLLEPALLLLAAVLFLRVCTWTLEQIQAPVAEGGEPATAPVPAGLAHPPPPWLLALDDAYIFVRYAQQMARGLPFEWNPGEASTGASSFLFPFLLVPGQWLFADLPGWSWWSRSVGCLGLFLLGLAGRRLLGSAGLPQPWPLVGGLSLILSGPIAFVSVAGMESAWNAAAVLLACALWIEPPERRRCLGQLGLLILIALLPLLRPENAFLTGLAALGLGFGRGVRGPRWAAPLVLLPGLGLAALHLVLTGKAQPAGALSKSTLETPFLPLDKQLLRYGLDLWGELLPVYLGRLPKLMWPPAGLLAMAAALAVVVACRGRGRECRRSSIHLAPWSIHLAPWSIHLAPLVAVWGVLCLLAPLSGQLHWQLMRHHHGALACAWLLAVAALALLAAPFERQGASPLRRIALRGLPFAVPVLLATALPFWGIEHARAALLLEERNGLAARRLQEVAATARERDLPLPMLLVNDAGLLSLAWDGPITDAMGLGTADLVLPFRHGPGALLESLARRPRLPEIGAVDRELVKLPQLFGQPLFPDYEAVAGTEVRVVRTQLLADAVLPGPGIDFAYLPHEEGLRWSLPPDPNRPSYALLRPDPRGVPRLHGCRVLYQRLAVALPPPGERGEIGAVLLRAAALGEGTASLAIAAGSAQAPASPALATVSVGGDRWGEWTLPAGSTHLWLENAGGAEAALPCLESLTFR